MTVAGGHLADVLTPLLSAGPGVATAARHGDQELVLVGGVTERGGKRPVRLDTRFEIGSLTKVFTGLLLAELVARGEVRPDDPVDRYLPVPARGITLERLATHTSGLPRLPPGLLRTAVPSPLNPYQSFSAAQVLNALRHTDSRPPDGKVRYSNFGVGLLGHALSAATTTRYETLLADRVLTPLGLADTDCSPTDQATGHYHHRPTPPWRMPGMPAAGALRSTAPDLLRHLTAYLTPTSTPLATSLADSTRPRVPLPGKEDDHLCLFWNRRHRPGRTMIFHGGATRGFTSFAGYSPESRTALVALTNTAPGLRNRFVQRAYEALHALATG
ncbi:serine hydrolase domain-containing protein [Saccharothrix obliqua]|uniref:serine hydrolase domain-containing protein n=1 Tax=Saccharothrix obliqua TaxID=2861747 RepID=UPI001C5D2DE3|nr:serine hydrolase domain-containing protein [Saccharothrix obliqua]MBW4716426.1 beta-lactamase family protein [Saccharothrix obliqua]